MSTVVQRMRLIGGVEMGCGHAGPGMVIIAQSHSGGPRVE